MSQRITLAIAIQINSPHLRVEELNNLLLLAKQDVHQGIAVNLEAILTKERIIELDIAMKSSLPPRAQESKYSCPRQIPPPFNTSSKALWFHCSSY